MVILVYIWYHIKYDSVDDSCNIERFTLTVDL